ncbi:MAG TPA: TraR/DksA C4-type zinc finger protein [Actinomycetota bacterium]|nr:TraR/DksA C4-type zinc finger protein [Actinomycetota bacterium]
MIDEAKLAELREALEEQRDNLRKEIVEQGGDPASLDAEIDVERNFADSAHSTAERARLLSVMKALRSNLRLVERALTKMDLGTYGPCERCGQPIGIERLEALPWVILCIDCARKGVER